MLNKFNYKSDFQNFYKVIQNIIKAYINIQTYIYIILTIYRNCIEWKVWKLRY